MDAFVLVVVWFCDVVFSGVGVVISIVVHIVVLLLMSAVGDCRDTWEKQSVVVRSGIEHAVGVLCN